MAYAVMNTVILSDQLDFPSNTFIFQKVVDI